MTADIQSLKSAEARESLWTNPTVRGLVIQVLLVGAIFAFGWWIVHNTATNLRSANIASGFGFLEGRAGFDISQVPIGYTSDSTYGHALLVGLVNTLIVAATGIVFATILGFIVGLGRLSHNFVVRSMATAYVEIFRNIPPLLVILFWYFGVLAVLPLPRQAIEFPFEVYLSNRGLQTPIAIWGDLAWLTGVSLLLGIVLTVVLGRMFRAQQMKTGKRRKLWPIALGLIVGLPLVVFLATGMPATLETPTRGTFNLTGGFQVRPEFLAIFLALSVYTASFIAEIVRAGVLAVSKGQSEAAASLGLRRNLALRLVIVPQALRVIIPPLTSQYLNLTKNSSLGLAIGYPDLVAVGSTVLNQSGQSIEVVMIWMTVYLGLSLTVSIVMNWFNRRMRLVER
ncbi:amino acid ABC transporter permease [Aureimonas altamirensis]|uniref:amino acid ABC transporter permease n=1 Tax=Aureimonas altamirensis TaxID=370622 RepID=UPI00203667E1|nr:amino acid ABC transporter permease [Aureimonas altamirensis]MCM2505316.1 amino acid ABC transporter permease [Aureimonas altamirensis]